MDIEKINIENSEDIKQYLALILGKLEFIDERVEKMAKITREEIQRLLSFAKEQNDKLKQFASVDVNNAEEVQRLKDDFARLQEESAFLDDDNLNTEIETFLSEADQNVTSDGGTAPAPEGNDTSDASTPVVDPETGNATSPDQVNSTGDNSDVTIDNGEPNDSQPSPGALPDGSTIAEDGTRTFPDGSKIDRNGVRTPPPSKG